MQKTMSIDEMEFLHLSDAKVVDFTKDRELTTILGYNKETNDLVRVSPEDIYENMLQDGARIVITKNVKDGKFVINHAYDATLLANINTSLENILKSKSSDCISSCDNQCMDFCSYNCSSGCSDVSASSVQST